MGVSGKNKPDLDHVELLNADFNRTIQIAADRIDQLYWVGILEESTRSMELLSHQLGYNKRIVLPRARTHTETHASSAKPSESDLEKLTSLMPHDIWIYNYAKSVFEARYTHFKTGVFEP